MHNRIKSIILATMADWEMQVKGKISMDSDFFATLLAIEIYKELQAKETPAARPRSNGSNKKVNEQPAVVPGQNSLLDNINLGSEVAK